MVAQESRLSSQRVNRRMAGSSRAGLASCPELLEPAAQCNAAGEFAELVQKCRHAWNLSIMHTELNSHAQYGRRLQAVATGRPAPSSSKSL